MSNPLEAFWSRVDLDASRVFNSPSFIFLCGGKVEPAAGDEPSLRALFYQHLKEHEPNLFKRVLLAELANKWSKATKHYEHLLQLEGDLAHLSAVILLLVESAGSIAELGAFCFDPILFEKLIAVLEFKFQDDESFIQDGPVAKLKNTGQESVLFYEWLGAPDECGRRPLDEGGARETVRQLVVRLSEIMEGVSEEEKFNRSKGGHLILLVCDLVRLSAIVKLNEIGDMLAGLGLDPANIPLERYLFLLEKLELIHKKQYGHYIYYIGGSDRTGYVRYALKADPKAGRKTAERLRLQLELTRTLVQLDANRKRALAAYRKGRGE